MEKVTKKNNNKNSKENHQKAMPNKTYKTIRLRTFLIVTIILASLLVGTIIAVVSEAMSLQKLRENMGQTFLSDGKIEIKEQSSNMLGFSIINNIISGVLYPQNVELNCNEIVNSQVVRFKAITVNSDGKVHIAKPVVTENWISATDGYYYYKNLANKNDLILVCKDLELPIDFSIDTYNKNKHILIVNAETLSYDPELILNTWSNLPENWIDSLE